MVTWHDKLIANPSPASDATVHAAERALRVRFPADFLAIARVHQGAEPIPQKIHAAGWGVTGVKNLLHFEEHLGIRNIVARRFPVEDALALGVMPFAEDVGDDLFCFNYWQTPNAPTVVFWSVDTGMLPLASSFTEFVALLHN